MKSRTISDYILKKNSSSLGRIIVLTGSRQTGKTTIIRHCFPDYNYLSIEDPVLRNSFAALTASQWHVLYPNAILDEVQKKPELIESIKSVYDQYDNTHYILSGSSQFLLMEKVKESLAGRCVIVETYPLTLPELASNDWETQPSKSFFIQYLSGCTDTERLYPSFLLDPTFAIKQNAYNHYLHYGGYPILTNDSLSDEERWEWLNMYVKTFLERDIRDLVSFRDLEPFVKLQRYLALFTGALINYSSIAKETGVSVPTIQRYIRYMEMSYQTVVLPAWQANPVKKLVKAPKAHFLDQGVLKAILQKKGGMTGNEYESLIIAEIYKQSKNHRLPITLYHFRTQDGREVDLLIETADYFIAIEIKMTEKVSKTDARHLNNLQEILNKPLKHSFILSNDVDTQHFGDNITAVHAAAFLG